MKAVARSKKMQDCGVSSGHSLQNILSLYIVAAFIALLLVGCDFQTSDGIREDNELIVFAAASLAEAFTELARQYEEDNPGVSVILNLAGSQQLAHQLSQGAPADIFASANEIQMNAAIKTGRVAPGSHLDFAHNVLVIVLPGDNPANIRTLADLNRPGLRLLLAAPEVPAGQYAHYFLEAAENDPVYGSDFREGVLENVVSYEENVRAVLSKVLLGEADAGIVYLSDVYDDRAQNLKTLEIPEDLNVIVTYPIAQISNSTQPALAGEFIDFILSPSGQDVLVEFGFTPVTTVR